MDGSAVMSPLAVDETGLARAAAAGDGDAFATLYRRYEEQLFNVAYRISGSEEIAGEAVQRAFRSMIGSGSRPDEDEAASGAYLLTETRNAAHDLMDGREGAESGAGVTNGNGALPDEQEEIGSANMRLPERQREALALLELGGLSYGEIAATMETQRDSVAQLISRGRINLGDELHGTVLASVAAPSPECERALPLIAMRDDDQLDAGSADAAWLDAHLADCERCRLGVEAMQEAAVSYRAWAPLAVAPSLLKATMAMAAELAGADWSKEIAEAAARKRARPRNSPGSSQIAGHRVQRPTGGAILAAAAAALLLLVALAAIVVGDEKPAAPIDRATEKSAELDAAAPRQEANPFERGDALRPTATVGQTQTATDPSGRTAPPATRSDGSAPTYGSGTPTDGSSSPTDGGSSPTDGGAPPTGSGSQPGSSPSPQTAVQPPHQTHQPSSPKPTRTPKPTPTASPAPAPAPTPPPAPATTTTEPAPVPEPVAESPGNSGGKGKAEPPGKPVGKAPEPE